MSDGTNNVADGRTDGVAPDDVRAQVARILGDPSFASAPQLSRLLQHLVENALTGELREVKEYSLGVELFDRGVSFDPRLDNIVRAHARRLRQRLEAYFDGPGRADPVVIEVPKGHYLAVFRSRPENVTNYEARLRVDAAQTALPGPAAVRKNSICVLPFMNMSDDVDQGYFSDGISEDIITDLSKVSALFVIARNTAFTFKAASVDVSQIARQLRVSHVLEGSVRKAGGRVRITAQLVDGASGGHVWAERYDRDLIDIFALQDEIAEAIVTALKLKLLPEEKSSIERRGTANPEAYDLYLRGTRPALGPDQQLARIVLLEAATRLAPDYADAWGELAKVRQFWYWSRPFVERDEIAKTVSAEIERALSLDPHNIAALGARFFLLPTFGRFVEAEALIRQMERIAPGNPDVLMRCADHLGSVGRMREAINAAQRAYEIDPLDPHRANDRASKLGDGGRYAEARQGLEDVLLRWPDQGGAVNLLMLCVHTEDWTTVDELLAPGRLARYPIPQGLATWLPQYASVMRDPSPESRRRPIETARRQFEESGTASFFVLQWAAQTGAPDEAHAIALGARFGPAGNDRDQLWYHGYRPSSFFISSLPEFRRDPRFVKLCARVGLVDYWLTTRKWPDCVDEVAPYYDFKAECARVAAAPPLPPANEPGSPPHQR